MENLKVAIEEWGLYNNGILVCKWWDYDSDYEEIKEYYISIKKKYNIDNVNELELFLADWENDELGICSENACIYDIFEKYEEYYGFNEHEKECISFLVENCFYSFSEAIDKKDDVIIYEANSYRDLAYSLADEGFFGEIPSHLEQYIDYDSMAKDLEMEYIEYNGKFFRAN